MNSMANSQIDIKRLSFPNADAQLLLGLKGDKGDTGDKGDKGDTGDTGNGIASITHTGTSGAVKTYTITFTDGTSQTYDVTDGQVTTEQMDTAIDNAVTDLKSALSDNIIKTNKYITSKNLVDKTKITDGYYINYHNGKIAANANYAVTDYIFAEPGKTYSQNLDAAGGQIAFYDINKKYVSGILLESQKTWTMPADCYYFRNSLASQNINDYAICEGQIVPFTDFNEHLVVSIDALTFTEVEIGKNLFNKNDVEVGYINYNTGRVAPSGTNFRASNYIKVEEGEQYTINPFAGGAQTAFYDEGLTYVSGILHNNTNATFTVPQGAKFLRTTTSLANLDVFAVCKGTSAPFTPYTKRTIIPSQYLPAQGKSEYDIIVAKDGSGDYTSLTDAVAHSGNGDIIYVKAGIYDGEEVEGWGKDITIIGEDMLNTVIKNGLNTYSRPPMELSCGRLSNMTVYAYDGGGASLDPNGWKPYSIHIDNNAQFENTLHIDNCILMSDTGAGIGIGLRKGELRFDNCKFVSRDSTPFYFHDTVNTAYGDGQYLTVKNCEGYAKNSTEVMRINSQKTVGSVVYPEFINNIFVSQNTDDPIIWAANVDNTGGQATTVGTFMNLINFYQVKTSRNNYPTALNYQP